MGATDQELLSRLLDDEDISEIEMRRILKKMQSSRKLRAQFQRYNIIGDAMRGQLPFRLHDHFSDDVVDRVNCMMKPNSSLSESGRGRAKMKAVAGLALAASLAVFLLVAFQSLTPPAVDIDGASARIVAGQVVEEGDAQGIGEKKLHNFVLSPDALAEFNSYVVNHAEYASFRVSMPHVRIVGYDQIQPENNE